MRKHFIFCFATISFFALAWCQSVDAQIINVDTLTHWKKTFRAGINLNQAAFSSNWKAGGVNSIGFNALLNYKANHKKDKHSWNNEIDLLYGMVNNAGQGYRKTLDRIFLDTKYGRAITKNWDFSASANFLSQFAGGETYAKDKQNGDSATLISDAFAPAYLTAALGFEYHPVPYSKLRLSPFSPRVTYVNNVNRFVTAANPTPYGVKPGETTRIQWFAFQALAEFDKDIAKNLNLKWRYIMFLDYEKLQFERIDHRLDLTMTARVGKFVTTSLGFIGMYFYDQDKSFQTSQALNIGLAYTFQNFEEKK
ncbi:MAG: DUF3078 domain-containing protein [Cytophagales bacterium]